MARILGIRIQRYKALGDVTLGQYKRGEETDALPGFGCLIGPNGSGKSSVLDAFGFLADCLAENVEAACDKPHRGGFHKLRTQGEAGPIEFEIDFREHKGTHALSYRLAIGERNGIPFVAREKLWARGTLVERLNKHPFLSLNDGHGEAWAGGHNEDGAKPVSVELDDPSRLGITTLGQLKDHPHIVAFRAFIEGWYLSYFVPDAARALPTVGPQKHLSRTGDNLGNIVQYMERGHGPRFKAILEKIARRIPGIEKKLLEGLLPRLIPGYDFAIYPHQGKGTLRDRPERAQRGVLDQLASKLRGWGKAFSPATDRVVLLVDLDDDDCKELLASLTRCSRRSSPRQHASSASRSKRSRPGTSATGRR